MSNDTSEFTHESSPFYVAEWLVDPSLNTITRNKKSIKLEPKAMRVLVVLAGSHGKVVTRKTLESLVWSGTVVGYDALSNAIIKIRKSFGDRAQNPRILETIPKSGYRLLAKITPEKNNQTLSRKAPRYPITQPNQPSAIPPLQAEYSIAVLAFENLSNDMDQEYFSDGLSEDIITDLSKIPGLLVVARNSSFAYKGVHLNMQEISQSLGARHILNGSVRRQNSRLRISVQLTDGRAGTNCWAERYDRNITDVFNLQDEIRDSVIAAMKIKLPLTALLYPASQQISAIAYDYFLRGRQLDQLDTKACNAQAENLLEQSIQLAPEFSQAYSHLSRNRAVSFINQWSASSSVVLESALELAQKAIELQDTNSHAHFAAGASLLWLRRHDEAWQKAEHSVQLTPNFSEAHALLGMIHVYRGETDKAIPSLHTAMQLDPHYRDAYLHILAQAYFHNKKYSLAADALTRRLIRKPDSDTSQVLLAATLGHLGQKEESRAAWQRAMTINPDYSLQHRKKILPFINSDFFDHIVEGLRYCPDQAQNQGLGA